MTPDKLRAECRVPGTGLYRPHPVANVSAVAGVVRDAFEGRGPAAVGRAGRLAVLAVDGLGWDTAGGLAGSAPFAATLTSEFPSTTVACMLSAVTGVRAAEHGLVGVHQLHPDGLGAVNCFDGARDAPTGPPATPRPTTTPELPTVFTDIASRALPTVAFPHELAHLHAGVVDRLFTGCASVVPPLAAGGDLPARVRAIGRHLEDAATGPGLLWCYVDLDTHAHRHGADATYRAAVAQLTALAGRLAAAGTSVVLFSDHGLAPHRPSAATLAAFDEAATGCRLPPGGAGRVRWLYPHATDAERLATRLAEQITDAHVTDPDGVAAWGMVRAGSTGQRRMGEIVLVARGPDFPGPDSAAAWEHGSMTEAEALVPLLAWPAG